MNPRNGPKSYYPAGPNSNGWAPKENLIAPSSVVSQRPEQTGLNSPLYANPSPQQARWSREQFRPHVPDSSVSNGKPHWAPHWGSSHHRQHRSAQHPERARLVLPQECFPNRRHQHLLRDCEKWKFSGWAPSYRIRIPEAGAQESASTRSSDDRSWTDSKTYHGRDGLWTP